MTCSSCDNLCIRGTEFAARGWRSAFYPIWYGFGALCFELGMLLLTVPLVLTFTPELAMNGGIHRVDAWYLALFYGLVCGCFFVFRNACQLMWWRHIESASPNATNRGEWIRDLPAVMALNLLKDLAVYACSAAGIISMIAILLNASALAIIIFALSGVLLVVISVIYPASLAQLMISGNGWIAAVSAAVKQVAVHPFRALAIRLCIPLLRLLCIVLIATFFANAWAWAILGGIVTLFIVTLVEPAFWMAAAKEPD